MGSPPQKITQLKAENADAASEETSPKESWPALIILLLPNIINHRNVFHREPSTIQYSHFKDKPVFKFNFITWQLDNSYVVEKKKECKDRETEAGWILHSCSSSTLEGEAENGELEVSSRYTERPYPGNERKSGEEKASKKEEEGKEQKKKETQPCPQFPVVTL